MKNSTPSSKMYETQMQDMSQICKEGEDGKIKPMVWLAHGHLCGW